MGSLIVIIVLVLAGWWLGLKMIDGIPRKRQVRMHGIAGMTPEQVRQEIERGGRFVQFTVSASLFVGIAAFTRTSKSDIHFLNASQSATLLQLRYTVGMALLLPLGPFMALVLLASDNRGKRMDVSWDVMQKIINPALGIDEAESKAASIELIKKYAQERAARKSESGSNSG